MTKFGVLIHQVNVDYNWQAGLPWMPRKTLRGQGPDSRFLSASFIYQSMRSRKDRKSIPLFSDSGGFLIRAEKVVATCAYGADGATWEKDCTAREVGCVNGCGSPPDWCAHDGMRWETGYDINFFRNPHEDGITPCFVAGTRPWRPEDVGFMLSQHKSFGPQYREPGMGMHSGYNEVVLDGPSWESAGLPHAVLAFFTIKDRPEPRLRQAHELFLQTYELSSDQVPLLSLDPHNWDQPFRLLHNKLH